MLISMINLTNIQKEIEESIQAKQQIPVEPIAKIAEKIVEAYKNDNKVLICGNGGSAADAQHIAGELVGRFKMERRALPCIALTTDTSIMTAYANDYAFDDIFARQIEALGNKNDILIAISTSGNSKNIIKAVEQAKSQGLIVIGFLGKDGGQLKSLCNLNFISPSDDTPRIQECHEVVYHIICNLIEKELFSRP